jgi:hypothetical protein
VTTLSLSYNRIGDTGAQALAKALETNTCVTALYLRENQIGDTGAQALAKALETNTCVTTLSLDNNRIGVTGAQALAKALETNTCVTTLYLDNNDFGDKVAQALYDRLGTRLETDNRKLIRTPGGVKSKPVKIGSFRFYMLILGCFLAYLDLGSDCFAAYEFYSEKLYRYFSLQLFFFILPAIYEAVFIEKRNVWRRLAVLFQLSMLCETSDSLGGGFESAMFLHLKMLETIIESIPSSMLQMVVVLSDERPLTSNNSIVLLVSFVLSVTASAQGTLLRLYEPKQEQKEWS